jgi:hypothetical protein
MTNGDAVILSAARRSRRIPWQNDKVFHRDSSRLCQATARQATSLGMTGIHKRANLFRQSTLAALDRNRFSRLIDGDQRKDAMRDFEFFAGHVTRHPNFDGDRH